ncbi:MAG: RluA family pseudouridine synthase [Pseudomonadota bacterium]
MGGAPTRLAPLVYAPPPGALRILHKDAHITVLDKPAGLLSVPGKDPAHSDCVQARLRAHDPDSRLVHRLDMDTSGVMVFARSPEAQRHLGLQFERRHVRKTYMAVVAGVLVEGEGEIDLPLIADWPNRPLQKVCFETGKPSQTAWRVVARSVEQTRLALFPRTGRSHQLRVHLMALGHPILGDRFYGGAAASRLMLHATQLCLRHPKDGREMCFEAPVPF